MQKKLKKIIVILCILSLFNNPAAYAAVTREQYQGAVVGFSKDFYETNGSQTRYWCTKQDPDGWETGRINAYQNKMTDGYWKFDCVGWVSFVLHHATGIGEDYFTFFATPTCCSTDANTAYGYEEHYGKPNIDDLEPGDILQSYNSSTGNGHVMIYVGDIDNSGKGSIIHCDGWGGPGGPTNSSAGWGVRCQYLEDSSYYDMLDGFVRMTDSGLQNIDESELTDKSITVSNASASTTGLGSTQNMSDFYYNGIPDGKYSVTKSWFERLIDSLAGIFDFLIGLITMAVRMVFVGWTAIIENLVTFTVKTATGGDKIESISVTSTDIESGDNITIEKIVFNQISVFDVNFFNFNDTVETQTTTTEDVSGEADSNEESASN